jgi:hypothetical protein
VLKDALKKHKRLSPQAKIVNLPAIQDAVNNYLPFLLALNTGSGYRDIGPERIDIEVKQPLQVEWRSTLSSTLPGREGPRVNLIGLHHELAFTFSTLAYTHSLLARSQLRILHSGDALTPEQRTGLITTAMKHLLESHSIHTYLVSLPSIAASKDSPVDIQPSTTSALASLALADATIAVVAKDDPYTAAVADDRNESNNDWMFKAPTIPQVRAKVFARICLAGAEHAAVACGLLARSGAGKVNDDLVKYANDLRRTARGKAARLLAIDAELSGRTGEGLAWLKGARKELGVEMLEAKWDKENSTMDVQLVPPFEPLLASMPSGREYHTPQPYTPPALDMDTLVRMRAPPEPDEKAYRGDEEDSGGEGGFDRVSEPVGAFPGTASDYGRSATSNSYY